MDIDSDEFSSGSRLKALLHHFAEIGDPREPWRAMYPLREILFLAVRGTVCGCDDYEHIAAWARRTWISSGAICPMSAERRAGAGSPCS